jgi:hypothetical protein
MSKVRVDGEVEIPRKEWYHFIDALTRMDELLEVIVKQLNYTNTLLARLTGVPAPTPPTIPEVEIPSKLISLPYRVRLAYTKAVTVGEDKFTEIPLMYDVFVMTSDADIYIAEKPEVTGFLLVAGTYVVFSRSETFTSLYVKSATGTANVYLAFFEVEE